jgi:uncharacterized membrane protein YkvI
MQKSECNPRSAEGEKLGRSTKVRHLLKHIQQMKHADPTAKCVIFSQWTSFLDILRVRVLLVVCVVCNARAGSLAHT